MINKEWHLKNKIALKNRLKNVGLDLSIYKKFPKKYIRINSRNPIKIIELEEGFLKKYGIKVKLEETTIKGIYESSNSNIGGWINGEKTYRPC
mgnify:FL=1